MANALYDKGREKFLNGDISWSSDTIKIALVRGYTADTATHEFLDDVTGAGGTLVATSDALAGKSVTNGVADASDVTFPLVASGAQCEHLVIYVDTGSTATSPLIGLIDTATGLPIVPNGGDITLQFDNGANKIFKL